MPCAVLAALRAPITQLSWGTTTTGSTLVRSLWMTPIGSLSCATPMEGVLSLVTSIASMAATRLGNGNGFAVAVNRPIWYLAFSMATAFATAVQVKSSRFHCFEPMKEWTLAWCSVPEMQKRCSSDCRIVGQLLNAKSMHIQLLPRRCALESDARLQLDYASLLLQGDASSIFGKVDNWNAIASKDLDGKHEHCHKGISKFEQTRGRVISTLDYVLCQRGALG